MFLRCSFEGTAFNCSELFMPIVTDEGQCCTFNTQPPPVMYKNVEPEVMRFGFDFARHHLNCMIQPYFHES